MVRPTPDHWVQSGQQDAAEEGKPATAPVPGVFEGGYEAGDIQVTGPGIERRWINSRCYMQRDLPLPR